jgi:hypothetical protein
VEGFTCFKKKEEEERKKKTKKCPGNNLNFAVNYK